jgi:hypothetical protein
MPISNEHQITIEKSPDYFENENVPKLIYKWNPKIKLILIIRNPIVRAISSFAQLLEKGTIEHDPNNFDLTEIFEKLITDHKNKILERRAYIRNGVYVKYLKNWLKYFSLEQILILNGEKLISDPYSVISKAEVFLGLKPEIKKESFVFNESKGFFCFQFNKSVEMYCLTDDKGRKHPFIGERLLKKLNDYYKEFDKQLFKLIKQEPFW